ncbi:MAG: class II aldolase/adducin family protein, partial [Thermoplasmata archaeon]|nr:class II aldolase/adducin family protein [Thermoplasmata archaeon]
MEDLKEALVMAAKEIYKRGLVQDGEGNLSIRIPGKDEMIITPTADIYMQLTKEDLVHINFDGT